MGKTSPLQHWLGCSFISWLDGMDLHSYIFKLREIAYFFSGCLLATPSLCDRAGVFEMTCSLRLSTSAEVGRSSRRGRLLVSNRCALTTTRVPSCRRSDDKRILRQCLCIGPSHQGGSSEKEAARRANDEIIVSVFGTAEKRLCSAAVPTHFR